VEVGDGTFRLKKSFEIANKLAWRIVILGEDEVKFGILTVKNFLTGLQSKVPREELTTLLKKPAGELEG
jgi:histidyl-tRNA synthetase